MLIISFFSLVLAFIFEGLSHGYRTREGYGDEKVLDKIKYNKFWHSFNVIFIFLLTLGLFTYSWFYFSEISYFKLEIPKDFLIELGFRFLFLALIRYCLFNYAYNYGSGNTMLYVGETATMDKLYHEINLKIFKKEITIKPIKIFPPKFVLILKVFTLIGVFLYM